MLSPTPAARLTALNRAFYAAAADSFAVSRAVGWRGWARLIDDLPSARLAAPLRVLDAGCGNARLAVYLAQRRSGPIAYHGIDSSPALLRYAAAALTDHPLITAQLDEADLFDPLAPAPLPAVTFDLVGAFGVLHHIPGAERRRAFVHQLAQRVAPGGVLAVTLWKFMEFPRFHAHLVPWAALPDPPADLEPGDHLLDWRAETTTPAGGPALRYCHYADATEEAALVSAAGLPLIAAYRSDGASGRVNAYLVWRRPHEAAGEALLKNT